jgi:hypothetical protein
MRKRCKRVVRSKGHILLENQVQKLVLPLHISLTLLPMGAFTREHADSLAKVINLVFVDSDSRNQDAYAAAKNAGEVLCSMFKRVRDGKSWNTTIDEREKLMKAISTMDHYVRRFTTDRFLKAAMTVDALNNEAKAKGYGFLDQAPVTKS